jgi:hypothetical protein
MSSLGQKKRYPRKISLLKDLVERYLGGLRFELAGRCFVHTFMIADGGG